MGFFHMTMLCSPELQVPHTPLECELTPLLSSRRRGSG